MGYINGQLRLQLYFPYYNNAPEGEFNTIDSGYIAVTDGFNPYLSRWNVESYDRLLYIVEFSASYFGKEGKVIETVYDYSSSAITDNLRVTATGFMKQTNFISGKWEVSFALDTLNTIVIDSAKLSKANNAAKISEIEKITISPFMVKLEGTTPKNSYDISIKLKDGTVIQASDYTGYSAGSMFEYNFPLAGRLDAFNINNVVSITVNGVEIII